MLDDMFSIMQRINEIKSRFGLKRHNPVRETPDQGQRPNVSVKKEAYDEVQAAAIADVNSKRGERIKAATVNEISALAEQYAGKNNIIPSLVKAVINTESGDNQKAESPRGAMGLMQKKAIDNYLKNGE